MRFSCQKSILKSLRGCSCRWASDQLVKCLRRGVHVGSRDVTNYSLLHCASIFADARALNTLIKAGSIFFQSYHFTPLNTSLLLYYRRKLDEILKIKIIPKVGYLNG